MDHETVEVQGEDTAGESLAEAPEDIRDDEGSDSMVTGGEVLGEDAARGGGDNGGNNREEEGGGCLLKLGFMPIKTRQEGKKIDVSIDT